MGSGTKGFSFKDSSANKWDAVFAGLLAQERISILSVGIKIKLHKDWTKAYLEIMPTLF